MLCGIEYEYVMAGCPENDFLFALKPYLKYPDPSRKWWPYKSKEHQDKVHREIHDGAGTIYHSCHICGAEFPGWINPNSLEGLLRQSRTLLEE